MCIGRVDFRIVFRLFAIELVSELFFLSCLGIPYVTGASHPLTEGLFLGLGRVGFESYSYEHVA